MKVKRTGIMINPDSRKVILKAFEPGQKYRINKIIDRIINLDNNAAEKELKKILLSFSHRHKNYKTLLNNRFYQLQNYYKNYKNISETKKLLIGANFISEYSLEAAALFNPSMVISPDQSDVAGDKKKFIISLRGTGEGHISSIVFRSGIIDNNSNIQLDDDSHYCVLPKINLINENHYEAEFERDDEINEKVLFPQVSAESNGLEDARFVEFANDNGEQIYYATYTAYDGNKISPKLLETKDFIKFKISSLLGEEIRNKGMALFPQKIGGKYAMLSRQDNENNFIMFSDDLYVWNEKQLLMEPKYPWEFIQLGNCGSPIETDEGWLCLSHGVGAVRKYSIGVFLLDKKDPTKIIARLKEPLLSADEEEREGYVPNVVYSCGGIINNNDIVIPYAVSDRASSFAVVNLNELMNELI